MKPFWIALLAVACVRSDDRWTLYRAAIAAADGALRLHETSAAQTWLRAAPEEYRGWEYRYLKAMSNRSVATLAAHDAAITGLAIDSTGELAATTSDDGTVRVWNAALGTGIATFQGLMRSPAFRPKARELAAMGADGAVRVWSVTSRREIRRYETQSRSGLAVAWSFDGKLLAAASGNALHLWDFEQNRLLWKSEHGATALAFHPNQPELVAGTLDGRTAVFAADGGGLPRVAVKLAEVRSVAFTASGFVAASSDGTIREFDSANAKLVREYRGHTHSVNGMAAFGDFTASGWIASGSSDQTVRLWHGASSTVLYGHNASVSAVAVLPNGTRILSGDTSGRLYWWDTEPVLSAEWKNPGGDAKGFAYTPDGRRAAVVSGEWITLVDAASTKVLWSKPGKSVAFSPDGKQLAFGNQDGHLQVADTATGEVRATWESSLQASAIAWSPDGAWIFGGGRVWDSRTGKVAHRFTGPGIVAGVVFSKDSSRLLLHWSFGQFSLIDLPSGRETRAEGVPGGTVLSSMAFHPDGSTFAVAASNRSIQIFETATLKMQRQIEGHTDRVYSVDYSPDGKRLVSASADRTVRLWDTATGEILLHIPFHSPIRLARFSADGQKIAVAPMDGRVVILGSR